MLGAHLQTWSHRLYRLGQGRRTYPSDCLLQPGHVSGQLLSYLGHLDHLYLDTCLVPCHALYYWVVVCDLG